MNDDEKMVVRGMHYGDSHKDAGKRYGWGFHCPGCGFAHMVNDGWTFNGDMERPTFSPSILVTGTTPLTDDEIDRMSAGEPITPKPLRCHSFVTDGKIKFLGDCTHGMANTTVPLEPF